MFTVKVVFHCGRSKEKKDSEKKRKLSEEYSYIDRWGNKYPLTPHPKLLFHSRHDWVKWPQRVGTARRVWCVAYAESACVHITYFLLTVNNQLPTRQRKTTTETSTVQTIADPDSRVCILEGLPYKNKTKNSQCLTKSRLGDFSINCTWNGSKISEKRWP